jgi:ParB family chromosome partitioning protein
VDGEAVQHEKVQHVALTRVVPSPLQPRTQVNQVQLQELVESIAQHGIIQPLIVRRIDGNFELIAGERRWRASTELGLETVPVIERVASDREVLEMALIENLQREDLNPIEEAAGYARLVREFGMKQDEIATSVGKSRATVANSMRLLDLQKDIQSMVAQGHISVGHAKAILGIKDKKAQRAAADEVTRRKLTVRATERLVKELLLPGTGTDKHRSKTRADRETSAMIDHITEKLRQRFSTHVSVVHSAKKGRIELEYYGNDDLGRVLELLGVNLD